MAEHPPRRLLNFIEDARALLQQTAAEPFGVEVIEADENGVTLRMEITAKARQPFGLLHGGVSMLLAETAASMHACWGVDLAETVPVGIEINGSHLRSATDGFIFAKAQIVRKSRTHIVHQVEIVHEESGRHLSTIRVTNFYKRLHLTESL
jgi:1,4-dihydroxy-2-naphthoyl-CoA hydrolase